MAIEVKGPTKRGTLRYITGKPVGAEGEARLDAVLAEARRAGIYTVGIGDAGSEIGCGRIVRDVERIHPNGRVIATVAETDALVIAATSNWGAYGIAAMLAFLLGDPEILHRPDMGRRMLEACARAGAGDGLYLVQLPMEDGQPLEVHMALITILDRIVRNGLSEIKRGIHVGLKASGYLAEEYRAGIESIEKGQIEAAQSLGMTYGRLMRRIVVPQAVMRMLPGILNQFVTCFKSTSIVSVIAVPDLMYHAGLIVSATFLPMPIYSAVAAMYFLMVLAVSTAVRRLSQRLPTFGYFRVQHASA